MDGKCDVWRSRLQTIYIGSLKGKRIPYFRAPASGLPMVHWREAGSSHAAWTIRAQSASRADSRTAWSEL